MYELDEFFYWLIHDCKLAESSAGSIVSHIRRLIEFNVPLEEDAIRSILWHKSKYMRRNYVRAVRKYREWLEVKR